MVFNATFNIISVISKQSVLLVEETGAHGTIENQKYAFIMRALTTNMKKKAGFGFILKLIVDLGYAETGLACKCRHKQRGKSAILVAQ
jgi:hypothetical protein